MHFYPLYLLMRKLREKGRKRMELFFGPGGEVLVGVIGGGL